MASINAINNTVLANNFTVPAGSITASANIETTAANLVIPTTSSTAGQIIQNSNAKFHTYTAGGGDFNTFIGQSSGNFTLSSATGQNNGLGFSTLNSLTSGGSNVAIGNYTLKGLDSGSDNVVLGLNACYQLTSGGNNVCVGSGSGQNYTSSESSNILIGSQTTGTLGESNKLRIGSGTGTGTGQLNAAYIQGIASVSVSNKDYVTINTLTGQLGSDPGPASGVTSIAGTSDQITASASTGAVTLSIPSTFIAPGSIEATTTVTATLGDVTITSGNLAITAATTSTVGQITQAGTRVFHTYGTNNLFVGTGVGNFTLSGGQNVGVSNRNTFSALTSGDYNTAVGDYAGASVDSSVRNSFFGHNAGGSVSSGAGENTLIGYYAGYFVTTGTENTMIGSYSASTSGAFTGSYNTWVGSRTGINLTSTGDSNIYIGDSTAGVTAESNKLRIGSATGTGQGNLNAAYIAGINGTTSTGTTVIIASTDQLTAGGIATNPSQPAFLVTNSDSPTNVTGDGTGYVCLFDTEIYDNNSDFSSNVFTAPVTGTYQFNYTVDAGSCGAAHTLGRTYMIASATTKIGGYKSYSNTVGAAANNGVMVDSASFLLNMTAADTAEVRFDVFNSTKTITYNGTTSWFSGYLVC